MRRRALNAIRFRWLLGAVFVGLAVPAAILIRHAFGQLELDALRQERVVAEQLHERIDGELAAAIEIEHARAIDEYRFVTRTGVPGDAAVQRSPLSAYPPAGALPGTIGYFEVDRAGTLTTPLLPDAGADVGGLGLSGAERAERRALEERVATVLTENRLLGTPRAAAASAPAAERERGRTAAEAPAADSAESARVRADPPGGGDAVRGQAAFDELASANAVARDTDAALQTRAVADDASGEADGASDEAAAAREQAAEARVAELAETKVATFQVEIEPFRFSRLDAAHFVLFRNVWRAGERYVQGVLLDSATFVQNAIGEPLAGAALAPGSGVTVAASGDVIARLERPAHDARAAVGTPLYASRLSPPLAEIELAFTAGDPPRGATHAVLVWTSVTLLGVLVGGFLLVYRLGTQQIELARQQQDFVSAVSHELKTPLTSIRMYGEMLKSGWVDETKRKAYYEFIYAEGERLSRLIDNVLRLARLSRGGPAVSLESLTVDETVEMLRAKAATQLEHAGVTLTVDIDADLGTARVQADRDALAQVFINLVDNAVKFTRDAARRELVFSVASDAHGRVTFSLRDFGPGLPPGELKRLFRLFYRPDNELTRTTAGTGIGLALVRQLVTAMGGAVDVRNRDPGAEFSVSLARSKDRRGV